MGDGLGVSAVSYGPYGSALPRIDGRLDIAGAGQVQGQQFRLRLREFLEWPDQCRGYARVQFPPPALE